MQRLRPNRRQTDRRMRCVRWAVLFVVAAFPGLAIAQNGASSSEEKPVPAGPPARLEKPLAEQQMIGAFWRTDHTFKATMNITNHLSNVALTMTPVLYMADGTEYPLASVDVPAHSVASVSINDALATAPPQVVPHLSDHGSAAVRYTWRWQAAVRGAIVSLDVPRSLTFTSRFGAPAKIGEAPQAHTTEGLWWTPFRQSGGFVSLHNATSNSLDAAVQAFGPNGEPMPIANQTIGAKSTVLLDLRALIETASHHLRFGGIRVSYQGQARSLFVNGGVEDAGKGYSARIPFTTSMPGMMEEMKSSIASAGMMVGKQDPMMGFPKDTVFRPYALVRNVSAKEVTVSPSINYQSGGNVRAMQLPAMQVQPNQTVSLLPSGGFAQKDLQDSEGYVNLVMASDAPADSLLTATGSVDQTGTYVFEVEPQAMAKSETKLMPYWNTGEGNDTMINLWNFTSKDQDTVLTFLYAGGQYKHPVHLIANGSAMVSVKELQSMGGPDADGNVLPKTVTTGSALISSAAGIAEELNVVVNAGTFNVLNATCGTQCPTCLGYQNFWVAPDPFGMAQGSDGSVKAYAQNTGNGIVNVTINSVWSSTNTSVATVVSPGTFYGAAAGSFGAQADINLIDAQSDCPENSHQACPTDPWEYQASGTVTKVTVTVNPSAIAPSGQVSVAVQLQPAASGHNVSLTATAVTSSGGHQHSAGRPAGTFKSSSGSTDGSGNFTTSYTASPFGGQETVTAAIDGVSAGSTLTVAVGGLVPLTGGNNYTLVGATGTHPSNHYGTPTANSDLVGMANAYAAHYPGGVFNYNDQSLPQGGLFDINANWTSPHAEHRLGINCDVSKSNITQDRYAYITGTIFPANGVTSYLDEGNHWHVRLGEVGDVNGE